MSILLFVFDVLFFTDHLVEVIRFLDYMTSTRMGLAFLEGAAAKSEGFHPWIHAAVDAHSVQFLATSAVELEDLEAWGDKPDVPESDVGELTAPLSGDADTAAEGHEHVADIFPAVEAFVGELPHAVHGVGSLGLGEEILESDLKMVIDAVRITVHKIDVGHFGLLVLVLAS